MTKPTVSNIKAGQTLKAGYRHESLMDENEFLGFKWNDVLYSNLKQLKEATNTSNLLEIEREMLRADSGSVTAEFRNVKEDYLWGSYLWQGSFRVGTSADKLKLAV